MRATFQRPAPSAASEIMPVSGRDKRVEKQGFHCRPVSQGGAAQLRRITQGPGQFARPGIVDGAGQADHQRRPQCLPGWRLSYEHGKDRSPACPRDRARRIITEVTADGIGVQRAQLNSRCRPEGHLETTFRLTASRYCWVRQVTTSCSPGRSASLIRLIAGPRTCSGISSSPSRIGRISPEASSAAAWVDSGPVGRRRVGEGRVVDEELGGQPTPEILVGWVPGRHRGQDRDGAAAFPAGKQVQHEPDHQHRLARAWLTEHDQPSGRHPGQHVRQLAALPGQVIRSAAQVPRGGGSGHPAPLVASFTSESQASVRDASAADQETGSG